MDTGHGDTEFITVPDEHAEAPVQYAPARPIGTASRQAPKPPAHSGRGNGHQNGRCVEVPLRGILTGLPLELQPRVVTFDAGETTISIPLEKVLSQLARGVVKISFGELRQAAPQYFTPGNDRDRVLVTLPLADVLGRLNPALITRRRVQSQVEVPPEVSSPFDVRGEGMVFSVGPAKPEPAPAPVPAPAPRHTMPAPVPAPAAPAAPVPFRPGLTSAPTPQPPSAPPKVEPLLTPFSRAPRDANGGPSRAAGQAAAQPAQPAVEANPLLVGLSALAESWPEAVRQEIVQLNLVDAKVALPTEAVERALKKGRIAFTWRMLRSWVRPTPLPTVSAHDGSVLELPLKVVAPVFLARQKEETAGQNKVSIDEQIPNLFFGFPQPAQAGNIGTAAKPTDTNYYVWDDTSDKARVDESEVKRPTPGTNFATRYATPNEIVSRAAALEGVAGALIALPDGLMVASRLTPDVNGETLAAFLPQIFGKVSQCTRELRMGDLNNLNFTVGNVPWKIFRVNAIFLAAFGRPAEPLPSAQLAALAAELDHKPR